MTASVDHEAAPLGSLSRVVALVGFPYPLPSGGRGLLERCGLVVVQFPTPQMALHTLRTRLRVDVIVIDAHHQGVRMQAAAVEALLTFAEAAPWDGVPLPVIVLPSAKLPADIREKAQHRGIQFVASSRPNYRAIARLARRLCGLTGDCCPGPDEPFRLRFNHRDIQ